jgi:hypothetical protein
VTARDEAIAATGLILLNRWTNDGKFTWPPEMAVNSTEDAAAVIDAIPGDVLVRLAIEQGALQPTEISISWAGTGPEVGRLTIDGIPTTKDTLLMYQIPEEKP